MTSTLSKQNIINISESSVCCLTIYYCHSMARTNGPMRIAHPSHKQKKKPREITINTSNNKQPKIASFLCNKLNEP